jgi:hypothetical protein
VQEIDREDPGGLGAQELPPRRARPARRRIDARSMQDLPDGGRRNRHAELHQLTVDAAESPQRILPRQADNKAGDSRAGRRPSRLAPLARVVLARCQPTVPGQQRRWVTGKTSAQRPCGTSRASAANQARSPGSYRTRPIALSSTSILHVALPLPVSCALESPRIVLPCFAADVVYWSKTLPLLLTLVLMLAAGTR